MTAFGRLRPLHTNAVIFAFAGNAIFTAHLLLHAALLKTRMFSDGLSKFHFWGWQAIIVAAALTLPLASRRRRSTRSLSGRSTSRSRWSGWPSRSTSSARCQAPRAPHLRGDLVLHRVDHHGRGAAHLQQPQRPRRAVQELLDLRRRAGRLHAVVVRPQRRRVLPDDAVPRPHVLLHAEGGRAAGLLVQAVHPALLVAGLPLHLGRPAPPALHRAAGLGLDARHGLLGDALDAQSGAAW
jgi:hypothetical protein